VRKSNSYALKASLLQNGFSDVELDHVPDNEAIVGEHYQQNKNSFDVLIYSGGVSKGKYDYLPKVWEAAGVQKYFHEVSQRPGKPLWFGVDEVSKTAVLGLPGNPVSSLVCLHRYFIQNRPMYAKLQSDIFFQKNLTYFVPVKIECDVDAMVKATPISTKNSGEFSALSESDGFIELPKDRSEFLTGETFRFYPWTSLW
jgi:molybdopterin molybdotransferase